MIKKINISENDRRTILSMHKLIVEQSGEITIRGTVRDGTLKNEPSPFLNVKLLNSDDKTVGYGDTDENGHYIMPSLTLPIGEYDIIFGDKEWVQSINIDSNTTTLTVDARLKVQELPEVVFKSGIKTPIPIFNVKVLNSTGENIDGAEIKIYYKELQIHYQTFVGGNDDGAWADVNKSVIKKTSSDGLKNIWIDPNIYTGFKSEPGDDVCSEHAQIKIVANHQGSETEGIFKTCLNNGAYIINTDSNTKIQTIRLGIKEPQVFEITLLPFHQTSPIQTALVDTQTTKVDSPNVIYLKIGFRDLIKKSKDEGKPAFIIFTKEGDTLSDELISRLNTNKETISKLNNEYIPVNYVNNDLDIEGFNLAADSLEIRQIPAIVIIKGNEDTQPKGYIGDRPIKGSYTEIKRVVDLTSYYIDRENYLTIINDLLK